MQRDFGDELLIAVVAIGVIAFAVVFGIVLSLVGAPTQATITLTPSTLVAAGESSTPEAVVPTAMTAVISASETPAGLATSGLTDIPTADDPVTATPDATDTGTVTEAPELDPTETLAPTETEATEATEAPTEQSASVQTVTPEDTATDFPTDTAEPTVTDTAEPTATATPEPSATDTLEPTVADTSEPTAADTLTATNTAEPTATDTIAPSDTPTDTAEPTATDTREPTATDTSAPTATATDTPEPTATDTLPPTSTATDTITPTATATDTREPTATATDTPEPTATDTATATSTDTPTLTATLTPTATHTETPTVMPTGTRDEDGACLYPLGYGRYMAGPEDTIESLAAGADLTADELRGANCFEADAEIIAGDIVYLPQDAEATPTPDGTEVGWTLIGCENPMLARITSPVQGAAITGLSPIIGTAFASDFVGYRLELRADAAVEYELLRELEVPALQSVLGTLDVAGREPGLYWLRLVVTTGDDEVAPSAVCVVPVFADEASD